jgi:hypothetical protein
VGLFIILIIFIIYFRMFLCIIWKIFNECFFKWNNVAISYSIDSQYINFYENQNNTTSISYKIQIFKDIFTPYLFHVLYIYDYI